MQKNKSSKIIFILSLIKYFAVSLLLISLVSCSQKKSQYAMWKNFRDHMPKSIVILPPINDSNELEVADITLIPISEYIAEAGYYVFPPIVVQDYFKSNGAPTAVEVEQIPYRKLHEIFGVDAALKIRITDYSYTYALINASWSYQVEVSLIDLYTGEKLWENKGAHVVSTSSGNPIAAAIGAAINLTLNALSTEEMDKNRMYNLSNIALNRAFRNKENGILLGPRRPNRDVDIRGTEKQKDQ